MTKPRRYLIRMLAFIAIVAAVIVVLYPPLQSAFMANAPLNGLISGVLLLGIIHNFRQVMMITPEVNWLENFRRNRAQSGPVPHLLMPMATMLREQEGDELRLSAISMRTVLDGIAARLDESRDISRYTIGLLVFLGLLGTFWGLLDTVSSIRGVIGSLSISGGDMTQVFRELKTGLEQPLTGMGTAFSSSLLGLAGSLILGFLDLQAGQAQNRFYNDLEEWLSSVTNLSAGGLSMDGVDQSVPAYVQALLERTADSLENLQRTLTRGEDSRIHVNNSLVNMGEHMASLADHLKSEQSLTKTMADGQSDIKKILTYLAQNAQQAAKQNNEPMDEATRTHIRNIDTHLARMISEMASGREEILQQVRSETKLLARTIAASNSNN